MGRGGILAEDRLIVALDVKTREEALALVDSLGESVSFYKIGLGLFAAGGYFELADELARRKKRIFFDLKLFDVPETVAAAVRHLREHPVDFVTVHGNDGFMAAAAAEKGEMKVLAVTALTSLDQRDIDAMGFAVDVESLVLSRAQRALNAGCDGVVSSGLEISALRSTYGNALAIVVPGIRPVLNRIVDDQKRTVDVEEAFRAGADYIVVGRPIRNAPDPRAAAEEIQRRIAALGLDRR